MPDTPAWPVSQLTDSELQHRQARNRQELACLPPGDPRTTTLARDIEEITAEITDRTRARASHHDA